MPIIGMTGDQAKLCPSRDRLFMDTKPRCGFLFGQHSAFPQAIIARA